MTRATAVLAGFLAVALFLPAKGHAQFRLIPQGGLYASVADLGTVDTPEGVRTVGKQETSLAYGLSLDFSSAKVIGYRITGIYGSDSEVPVGGVGCSGAACDLRSTLLGVSAGIVLRPFPATFPFRPYLLGGGGIKRYDFDFGSDSPVKDAFGDESQTTGVVGVGFDWNLGILKGNLELVDYVSGALLEDGDRQHDFFLTVGLVLG
jgi:hypothetical protein